MVEDLNLGSESLALEELAPANHQDKESTIYCDWDPCSYKSREKSLLIKHIDEHIGLKQLETKSPIKDMTSHKICDLNEKKEVIIIDDSAEEMKEEI